MDIYCKTCGEPWDNDCIHEEVTERNMIQFEGKSSWTYDEVAREFRSKGCKALEQFAGPQRDCIRPAADSGRGELAAMQGAMYDVLGDDMDGAAAMMEDFRSLYGHM